MKLPSVQYEILNFSESGYDPIRQIYVLDLQAGKFDPDVVLLVGHLADFGAVNYLLRKAQRTGLPIPHEFLRDVLRDARISQYTRDGLAEIRLQPFVPSVVEWSFTQIVREARSLGAVPVYFFFPAPGLELPLTGEGRAQAAQLVSMAGKAGFVVLDGTNLFDQMPTEDLVTGIVGHSNAKAHAMIADFLYQKLTTEPRVGLAKLAGLAAAERTALPSTQTSIHGPAGSPSAGPATPAGSPGMTGVSNPAPQTR